ncbi:hypothetical protein DL96DRAFT_427882 [Flagelloscypha sp. PMI_526]|nr:hypothetical protein DL96DRAFT_427882 [Flagelloscypha sp. PMI_526]
MSDASLRYFNLLYILHLTSLDVLGPFIFLLCCPCMNNVTFGYMRTRVNAVRFIFRIVASVCSIVNASQPPSHIVYYSIVNGFKHDTEDEWARDVIGFITSQTLTSIRFNHLSHQSSAPASSDPNCSVSHNALARKARKLACVGPTDTTSR